MIQFEADKKHLTYFLDQIENRDLALPDFQRSFVWDPGATRELVVSIVRSFPAGSLLLMRGGGKVFAPRQFEEAPSLDATPAYLVLDGQQRLTSLYQAFSGTGAHRFFLNLRELLDGLDVDEAVEVYPLARAKRWNSIEAQARDLMLPFSRLRSFADWKDEVVGALEGQDQDIRKLSRQLNELEKEYVEPVRLYQFPVTTLSDGTPAEAVCTIFETLNRTGIKLSVFELITARAFAKEVRLRDMWKEAQAQYPVIDDLGIDPYYVLQIVALMAKGSPKRGVVLALPVEEIVDRWSDAVEGLASALMLLRDECGVLHRKWLPYYTMLIPMAAAWKAVVAQPGPKVGANRAKLKRWFWCSVFSGQYENTPNFTTERDLPELETWLVKDGTDPTAVRSFQFDPQRWREVTYRQRAMYRGSMALLMRHHPLDFHSAKPLTKQLIDEEGVDDHHIFPRGYLKNLGSSDVVDSVLNHTLIDRKTNIRISDKAPSKYLSEMEGELKDDLHRILQSHRVPSDHDGPLFGDRFDEFLDWRLDHLTSELIEATGATADDHGVLWGTGGLTVERGMPEESSHEGGEPSSIAEEVRNFVAARGSTPARRAAVERFLVGIGIWPGVKAWVGRSTQTKDGWAYSVNVTRQGFGGSFLYIYPSSLNVVFRLLHADAAGLAPVELRNTKEDAKFQVRASLSDEAGFAACLALAKRAYDATFRSSSAQAATRHEFDWSPLHDVLKQIPEGRWTTYGDLAEVVGTAPQPLGQHIMVCEECQNAHRVLGSDGRPRPNFAWTDPADTRTQLEALEAEGVQFRDGAADSAQRLERDQLEV